MAFTSRKKAANKKMLFPIDRNFDSTSQNEGFVKKTRFHYAEKLLLSPAETSKKKLARKKWFQIVWERLPYKKWFHLNLNNGTTIALIKRRQSRKSVSTRRNGAFDGKSVSTSRKSYFPCKELQNSKKTGLHLISSILSTSRKNLQTKAESL